MCCPFHQKKVTNRKKNPNPFIIYTKGPDSTILTHDEESFVLQAAQVELNQWDRV